MKRHNGTATIQEAFTSDYFHGGKVDDRKPQSLEVNWWDWMRGSAFPIELYQPAEIQDKEISFAHFYTHLRGKSVMTSEILDIVFDRRHPNRKIEEAFTDQVNPTRKHTVILFFGCFMFNKYEKDHWLIEYIEYDPRKNVWCGGQRDRRTKVGPESYAAILKV